MEAKNCYWLSLGLTIFNFSLQKQSRYIGNTLKKNIIQHGKIKK